MHYIGSTDQAVIRLDKDYYLQHKLDECAGGSWILRYPTALQGHPRLAIDLNFLTRVSPGGQPVT